MKMHSGTKTAGSGFAVLISRYNLLLLIVPFSGGLSLVIHILTDAWLFGVLALVILGGATASLILIFRTKQSDQHRLLLWRLKIGLVAGTASTIVYDATRYGLVVFLSWSFDPFHAWLLFGQAMLSPTASITAAWTAGFLFHCMNGVGFSVAFALLFRAPTVPLGVIWGLGLEFVMALLYPSWMRMAQLEEFLSVSIFGHVSYGVALGLVAGALTRSGWLMSSTKNRADGP